MTENDLLQLAEREAQRLADENDHCAAIIIRSLIARLREPVGDDFDRRVVAAMRRAKVHGQT